MTITVGKHVGRVTAMEDVVFGYSGSNTEQVGIPFVITQGEHKGECAVWYGSFSERGTEITLRALRACGWKGDDLSDLTGITDNEVSLDFQQDEYEGQTRIKLKWVNALGGKVRLANQMDPNQLRQFAAQMKGDVIAHRQSNGAPAPAGTRPASRPPAASPPPAGFDKVPF